MLYQYAETPDPVYNDFCMELEGVTDPGTSEITLGEDDTFGLVPVPYYTQPLLSSMFYASQLIKNTRPHPKIPDGVLAGITYIGNIGYSPNPRTFKRNQEQWSVGVDTEPRFRSQQQRMRSSSASSGTRSPSPPRQDKVYSRVEIKYSK